VPLVYHHAQPLAHEVVGDLVYLGNAGEIGPGRGLDSLVQRIGQPGLEMGVEVSEPQHLLRRLPGRVQRAVQPDDPLGEGAGLVGAQHVHATEILDGRQAAHDDARVGHALAAARQVDVDDRGQELGRQPHGQRQRKEQGIHHRLVEEDVGGKHHQHQHERHLAEQIAQAADAALELGLGRPQLQPLADLAERGGLAGLHDDGAGRAAAHAGAHEDAVRAPGQPGRRRHDPGRLLHREGLTGEGRLVHEEVPGLQHDAVGGDQAAGRKEHDIPRHDLFHRHRPGLAIAQHGGPDAHLGTQLLGRVARAVLLHEAQHGAADHDGEDDGRVGPILQNGRNEGSEEQDEDDGAFELAQEEQRPARTCAGRQAVGAEAGQARAGLVAGQAVRVALQGRQQGFDRLAPEGM